jgi:hypothetical protein
MIEYTGPVPPTPGTPFDAAQWTVWQNYQTILGNIRLANEREARAVVTDKQHADDLVVRRAQVDAMAGLAASLDPIIDRLLPVWAAHDAAVDRQTTALDGLAAAIAATAPVPAPAPVPDPLPAPTPAPNPVGLVAETVALARKWAAVYATPTTSP